MNASTSSIVYRRRGKTTSKIVRSCDTVRAGAFFPQAQLQVPQKEMRQHRRQYMVMPARIFADFIVVHPQLGFAFFKALFHGPAQATQPDKGAQRRTRWGIAHILDSGVFCCLMWVDTESASRPEDSRLIEPPPDRPSPAG